MQTQYLSRQFSPSHSELALNMFVIRSKNSISGNLNSVNPVEIGLFPSLTRFKIVISFPVNGKKIISSQSHSQMALKVS
jgi:hypothetical protein